MLEQIEHIDIQLLVFLNNLGSETWDGFWMFMTTSITSVPLYLLAVFFVYKYFGIRNTLFALLFIGVLISISDQTSNLFKYGFERLRPCHDADVQGLIRLVKPHCGGQYSFFSAHASTSMAIVVFLAMLLRKRMTYLPIVLIVWSLLVGYSRIYIGVHFPFDVLAGFCFGATLALLMSTLYFSYVFKPKT